jgi:hypothetical protein
MEKTKVINNVCFPADLIAIRADGEVDVQGNNLGTVYANIACPGIKQVWYRLGGFPTASKGNWQAIDLPWNKN